MKKQLLILALCLTSLQNYASHLFGGELTWACQSNGKYIFTLKVYRDCNGIPYTIPTQLRVYGNPNLTTIPLGAPGLYGSAPWVPNGQPGPTGSVVNDISPFFCPNTCATGGSGTIQEFIIKSDTITLSGVPPASGWTFETDDCCRNGENNLVNGSGGFTIRATMYPFNNLDANPCYDSSPYFAEKPNVFTSIGYPFTYNPLATDAELDSISYSWDYPIDQPTTMPPDSFSAPQLLFSAPYSITSPLPGSPTLDSLSGQIQFTNTPLVGKYASCIKATSYKCGIKVAEIFRDIGITFTAGCTIYNGSINLPPVVVAPFVNQLTGLYTSYADTVFVGDTVHFNLSAIDYQYGTYVGGPNIPQSLSMGGSGSEFGSGFTSTTTGCTIPPCATVNPPLPTPFTTSALTVSFNWGTTPAHLGLNYGCVYMPNTYYFLLKASDNYCPAPAYTFSTISITVLPTVPAPLVTYGGGQLNTAVTGYGYQWYRNRFPVVGATASSYTPVQNGFYQLRIMDSNLNGNYSDGISITTGIDDPADQYNIVVYPNPTKGLFTLQLNSGLNQHISIAVKDIIGRNILAEEIKNHGTLIQKQIDISKFAKGVYNLQLKIDNTIVNKKITLIE